MAFKCSFCGMPIVAGTGKLFARNDGKVLYFCTRRCEKNIRKLNRKARETAWTMEARIARGKARAEE